jgi:effector-binding domain-containing protein
MTAPVVAQKGEDTKTSEAIAMTAPVVGTKVASEKIAMTAPVVATEDAGAYVVSFVMPRSYTLETLPTPNDARVQLVAVPERKVAALRYSGYRSTSGIETMKAKLLELLERDGVSVVGTPSYAGYNAPGTPPWLSRHEVLVEVK